METIFELVNYHWKWFGPTAVLVISVFVVRQAIRLFSDDHTGD